MTTAKHDPAKVKEVIAALETLVADPAGVNDFAAVHMVAVAAVSVLASVWWRWCGCRQS